MPPWLKITHRQPLMENYRGGSLIACHACEPSIICNLWQKIYIWCCIYEVLLLYCRRLSVCFFVGFDMAKDIGKKSNDNNDTEIQDLESTQNELEGMLSYFMNLQNQLLSGMGTNPEGMNEDKLKEINAVVQGGDFTRMFGRLQEIRQQVIGGDDGAMPVFSSTSDDNKKDLEEIHNQLRAMRGKIKQILDSITNMQSSINDVAGIKAAIKALDARISALEKNK